MRCEKFFKRMPRRRSKSRISKRWKSKLISILSIISGTALATPQHLRMCPKGQLFKSVSDGLSVTLPRRVYAKCHGKILTSMMGLMWASMVVPLIEQGVIVEGELIQIASEKCFSPFDNSSLMASLRDASLRISGGERGIVGLREGFVKRSLD